MSPRCSCNRKTLLSDQSENGYQCCSGKGVTLLAAQKLKIPIFEYTPLQVKTAVTGYGKAKKPQVMEMTARLLKLKEIPKPDDTCDALAIAICHTQAAGSQLRRVMYGKGL